MRWTKIADWQIKTLILFSSGVFLFLLIFSSATQAKSLIPIYDTRELSKKDGVLRNYLQFVFRGDLLSKLPLRKRARLSNVRLMIPMRIPGVSPMNVGASISEEVVYFPMETAAFLDDLAALAAWLEKHNCSFEPAALYAGMIVSKRPPNRGFYPNPRSAFGLGDDVWKDSYIKKGSNDIFKTTIYFLLAHELGHIYHGHAKYDRIQKSQAQQQELEADKFAIEAMRHIGVPPLGMFHFFTVLSRMEGNIPITHPLSGGRLEQIAAALQRQPENFVPPNESRRQWAPVIGRLAGQFRSLIPVIDNVRLRNQLRAKERFASWSELPQSCVH